MAITDSYEVALATKLQLQLLQPTSNMFTKLVNRDYEGDVMKIGDTVSIVKTDPDAVNVVFGVKSDARPSAPELNFDKNTFTIDKSASYAFLVSDINNAEGKWNYESAGLDGARQKLVDEHNLDIANLICNSPDVPRIGSPTAPIEIDGDTLYSEVLVKMFTTLYGNGAITADGTFTSGSNPEEAKRTMAGLYLPTEIFGLALTSKYITDRSTVNADGTVASGSIKELLGMQVEIEPILDPASPKSITVEDMGEGVMAVIAGTANTVTFAGKVLKPDKQRDTERFADKYSGLEIFGRKVAQPKSAVVAFVKVKPPTP